MAAAECKSKHNGGFSYLPISKLQFFKVPYTMQRSENHQCNSHTVFFTGGGTGGHVYPGIAVLEAFRELAAHNHCDSKVFWIGSRHGMERGIVESKGIRYIGISSGKLRRYFSFSNLFDVFKVVLGIVSAFLIMKRYRPKALFSKGGYVSVPPVIGAKLARIPVITHESDFDPGLATRINARFASKIAVSYYQTRDFFQEDQRDRVLVTGNPVRPEVLSGDSMRGLTYLSFTKKRRVLLVVGGSQGAREVNLLLWSVLPSLIEKWNVVHQTGEDASGPQAMQGYRRYSFIRDQYGDILAASDLVLCRAGATTLWELAASQKPSILVPLGAGTSRGDQMRNAALFEQIGASYVLNRGSENGALLVKHTEELLARPGTLIEMGRRAGTMFKPRAAQDIAVELFALGFGEKKKVIVSTPHYAHRGRIGDIYTPGAKNNASGVAMLLDIARHYAKSGEEPEYTLVFIFFTGEEFGLLGSDHYVNFPLFPLEDIELVINLDMVGTGENGIGVAGGKIYEDVFEEIVEINEENGYLKDVKAHGMSRSSDHYPFHEKGVPAIFIHTKGHYPHYHNIYDNRESIPLTGYEDLFRLLTDLIEKL